MGDGRAFGKCENRTGRCVSRNSVRLGANLWKSDGGGFGSAAGLTRRGG
jgi:hypothetical protein